MAGRRHLASLLGGAALLAALLTGGALYGAAPKPCESNEVTASISDGVASGGAGLDRMTIVLAGDAGFNASDAQVDAKGWHKGRQVTPFADMTSGIAKDIDGDLAFVNLETVVTDRNDLKPERKSGGDKDAPFHFRSHPAAVKNLIGLGFNLFSLANNHASDYGAAGIEETLYHLAVANTERPVAFAGIGANFEEAIKPACLDLSGTRIGFDAIGIISGDDQRFRATDKSAGQASYRNRPDFEAVVSKLAALPADYRILSIHYGLEGRVVPDDRQLAEWRDYAAGEKGIDLIVGHHPHVAQGVELDGKSLIFYGLGNFLHPGTTEMSRFGPCRDYGLMAKIYLARIDGVWRVMAIEAIPLTNTQTHPERFVPKEAELRIEALNHLAARLDDPAKGAKGVRFTPQSDGSGLYCAEGAAALGGKIGALCKDWLPAAEPMKPVADKIEKACADKPFYGQPAMTKRRASPRRDFGPSPFPFGGLRPF
ncbi:CapA family protein [Methyloceanibacter sp.]|uniref:CapA family protein n=1 Tax=Methyloceanibacter sp. TaxID=1965321 RepID=UPI002D57D002|nr:CapA family protein [Methyloceanibacter sp.]HZP07847.1 CapA family protein [Methyloceanibacter sp.]